MYLTAFRGNQWPCGLPGLHLITGCYLCAASTPMTMLRACPNMTLAVEHDVTPKLTNFSVFWLRFQRHALKSISSYLPDHDRPYRKKYHSFRNWPVKKPPSMVVRNSLYIWYFRHQASLSPLMQNWYKL